jgi:hypothetical protein
MLKMAISNRKTWISRLAHCQRGPGPCSKTGKKEESEWNKYYLHVNKNILSSFMYVALV